MNIVPESFKPAVEAITRRKSLKTSVQPDDRLEGQFAAAEPGPGGRYQYDEEARYQIPDTPRTSRPSSRRRSADSDFSMAHSVYRPRRVESFMSPQDLRLYQMARASQRPAGGAFYTTRDDGSGDVSLAKAPIVRSNTLPRDRSSSLPRDTSSSLPRERSSSLARDRSASRPRRPNAQRSSSAVSNTSNMSSSSEMDWMPASYNPFNPQPHHMPTYGRERSPLSKPALATVSSSPPDPRIGRGVEYQQIEMTNLDGTSEFRAPDERRGRDPTPRPEHERRKLRKRSLSATQGNGGNRNGKGQ